MKTGPILAWGLVLVAAFILWYVLFGRTLGWF